MDQKYSISYDEEIYNYDFDSIDAACQEAAANRDEGFLFWVGEKVPPPSPEGYFDADDWIEQVKCQDEYSGDWAEGCLRPTKEQLAEINQEVQEVLSAWIDRHGLRPTFFNVSNVKSFRALGNGKYELLSPTGK